MSQHYVAPRDIDDPWAGRARPSRLQFRALEVDGQIVPLLVTGNPRDGFTVANDIFQRERLVALRELDWPTVLVETSWTEDDL